ncbi:DUF6942 family protein [Planctobacterium marinum]|uniref:DUF6942 family protein n=1 Tax=Planctobacterium marinum TaxID=1631968 RepID=UPI001E2EDFD9|nr:hypothetical protein [Planctobacterium marinum]MCC2607543.1 hypothetical protein [Planctobacterium marinum]
MNKINVKNYGLGDVNAIFRVYIGNIPDYQDVTMLDTVRALHPGEIKAIGDQCGNGWRKVFNVYAKLVYALRMQQHILSDDFDSWQTWRDKQLLQAHSDTVLLFSAPDLRTINPAHIHIVMGKTWARDCGLNVGFTWLNHEFAVHSTLPVVICPYFDYRQLSNQKIVFLCELLEPRIRGCCSAMVI